MSRPFSDTRPRQLPLRIGFTQQATFENFIRAGIESGIGNGNRRSADALREWVDERLAARLFFLWGPPGSGRSHLLAAACGRADARRTDFAYLPLGELAGLAPAAVLQDLESRSLVCIDDIDAVAGQAAWEEALFHLYNRLHDSGHRLLISAAVTPADLAVGLADLSSRLASGLCYRLRPLDDDGKRVLLLQQATERGLALSAEAADYLLSRCARDTAALVSLMDRLDTAALAAQRRLTIPFLRSQLEITGSAD